MTQIKTNYSNPELEQSLQNQRSKISPNIDLDAKHFAKEGRPYLKGDSLDNYIGRYLIQCDEMIVQTHQSVRPETSEAEIKEVKRIYKETNKDLKQKLQDTETEINNLELEIKKNNEGGTAAAPDKDKKFNIILFIIGAAEVALTTSALQLLGYSLLFAFIISFGLTAALFYIARNLAKHLKESDQPQPKKILLAGGITILVLITFYFLADLRTEQLKEQSQYDISPMFLLAINVLFYIVTLWHYYRTTPHKSDTLLWEKQALIKKTHAELLQKKEELENQIEQLKAETEDKIAMLRQKPEYVKWMTELIEKWKEEIAKEFIATNLAYRTDRKAPDCFRPKSNNQSLTS